VDLEEPTCIRTRQGDQALPDAGVCRVVIEGRKEGRGKMVSLGQTRRLYTPEQRRTRARTLPNAATSVSCAVWYFTLDLVFLPALQYGRRVYLLMLSLYINYLQV
jgi:hypothetical protein